MNSNQICIPNHYSATLSQLDLLMAVNIPPGGNWKNIPESIPSKRLEQIRKSFALGQGSRSTYYGRLHPKKPSYTINTYFNRPGNGCHLHYDFEGGQHRVISQREAARLQSFPDKFVFFGSQTAVNKQIGNAVPPLLAYQVARTFPFKGLFLDLFSGAGGLSLGFTWAGWESIVANDIEAQFLSTYEKNIHASTVHGDIRDPATFNGILEIVRQTRAQNKDVPLFVLGGPPCQGFSTAGNRRSMDDSRNQLFYEYKAMLEAIKPSGFVFENVTGLLNMEGGRVFEVIKSELSQTTSSLAVWKLGTENYGIPQKRTRLLIVGCSMENIKIQEPTPITFDGHQPFLVGKSAPIITAEDALSDLPPLLSGEDGSKKCYCYEPNHPYQAFMRSQMSVKEYIDVITSKV